jgi:hypothetical protein
MHYDWHSSPFGQLSWQDMGNRIQPEGHLGLAKQKATLGQANGAVRRRMSACNSACSSELNRTAAATRISFASAVCGMSVYAYMTLSLADYASRLSQTAIHSEL